MQTKLIGAVLIVAACGSLGLRMARSHLRQQNLMRQLIGLYDFMECELQYRMTPLPDLCLAAAGQASGPLRHFFITLSRELEAQISPDVSCCVTAAAAKVPELPVPVRSSCLLLGKTLGRFDLEGQIRGLEAVRQESRRVLTSLEENRSIRLRSYQTLGICAGCALVILFI